MVERTSNVERPPLNSEQSSSTRFDLGERLLEYAAQIIRLVELLPKTRTGNHVAGQLLRAGTSPLPNHAEAQAAESADDFVHKMSICLKELRESERWLLLIKRVPLIEAVSGIGELIGETDELIRIFKSSIRTAQRNSSKQSSKLEVRRSMFNVRSLS